MIKEFYFVDSNRNRIGPIDFNDRHKVSIKPTTLIWYEGLDNWAEANSLPDFKTLLRPTPPPIPDTPHRDIPPKFHNSLSQKFSAYEIIEPISSASAENTHFVPNEPERVKSFISKTKSNISNTIGHIELSVNQKLLISFGALLLLGLVTYISFKLIPFIGSILCINVKLISWLFVSLVFLVFAFLGRCLYKRTKFIAIILVVIGIFSFGATQGLLFWTRLGLLNSSYNKYGSVIKHDHHDIRIYDRWGNELYYENFIFSKIYIIKNCKEYPDAKYAIVGLNSFNSNSSKKGVSIIFILLDKDGEKLDSHTEKFLVDNDYAPYEFFQDCVSEIENSDEFQIIG